MANSDRPAETNSGFRYVDGLVLAGAGLLGVAAILPQTAAFLTGAVGIVVCFLALGARLRVGWPLASAAVLWGSALLVVAAPLARIPTIDLARLAVWVLPMLVGGWMLAFGRSKSSQSLVLGALLVVGGSLAAGAWVLIDDAGAPGGVDVYVSHVAAADALAQGLNPYTDAVRFEDGAPRSSGPSVLEGYVYPPIALALYASSAWLLGDPRWLSLLAWGICLIALTSGARVHRGAALGALAVFAAAPAWRLVLYSGWTEPVTLLFLLLAALSWRRPVGSGVLLGLALASKQYMIVLLPLLLLMRDPDRRIRTTTAIGTVLVTFLPFLLWDWRAFIESVVVRQLSQGFRSDMQSLPGVLGGAGEMTLYITSAVVAAVVASWYLSRRTAGPAAFLMASALALAVFFALGQALVNYWFLVGALVAAAVGLAPDDGRTGDRLLRPSTTGGPLDA